MSSSVRSQQSKSDAKVRRNRWPQRAAVVCGVALVALIFSYSQSDVAFAKRVSQSKGFLRFSPTAPAWMRDYLPLKAGESLAVWFDTPSEFFVGADFSAETLQRAAQIKSLRWVVFDNRLVTEQHVAAFRGHRAIKGLRLANTEVTDGIFPVLASLPQLAYVSLDMTNVTPEGLEEFRKRHPRVEVEIDAVTASGLQSIANGRASYRDSGISTLTLRGPIDEPLLTAAKRLPVRRLALEGVDAGDDLVGLIEALPIDAFEMRAGRMHESFAKALSVRGLRTLELSEIRLTSPVASALAKSQLNWIALDAVVCEPKALSLLLETKRLEYLQLQRLVLSDDDIFQSVTVQELELNLVEFRMKSQPFRNASIGYLRLSEIEAEETLFAELARLPSRSLMIAEPSIHGPAQGSWPAAINASSVSLVRMPITPDEARTLAAVPIERLSLAQIDWHEGSPAAFVNAQVEEIYSDRLPAELAEALTESTVERLSHLESISGNVSALLGRLKRLKQLDVRVESPTPEQIAALVDAPSLELLNLKLIGPPTPPVEFWRHLAGLHPKLQMTVWLETPLPSGQMSKRLWPE